MPGQRGWQLRSAKHLFAGRQWLGAVLVLLAFDVSVQGQVLPSGQPTPPGRPAPGTPPNGTGEEVPAVDPALTEALTETTQLEGEIDAEADGRTPVVLPPTRPGGRERKFLPPPEVPEAMKIEKPLLTLEEEQQFRRKSRANTDALKSSLFTPEQEKLIAELARMQVYALSIPEYRKVSTAPRSRNLADLRGYITRTLKNGTSRNAPEARQFYLREIVKRCKDLLDGHFAVRVNAVVLLSQLNEVEAAPRENIAERPYMPAMDVLIAVLQNKQQPDGLKLVAARGLHRFFERGNPTRLQETSAAEALVAELDRKKLDDSYQYVLTQSLGASRVVWDQQKQKPIVPQKLAEVIVDKSREWIVRCGAADAMGRLPLDGTINIELIVFEIVKLGHDMSEAHNKAPDKFFWKECFWHLHLAFKRKEWNGADAGLTVGATAGRAVQDGYGFMVSLNNHVLPSRNNDPIPTATIDQMAEWLRSHQPANNRLTPTQPPIADAGVFTAGEVRAASTGP